MVLYREMDQRTRTIKREEKQRKKEVKQDRGRENENYKYLISYDKKSFALQEYWEIFDL